MSSTIHGNIEFINLSEFCSPYRTLTNFTEDEIKTVQKEFKNKIEIRPNFDGSHSLITFNYIGYIVLGKHIIYIHSKVPRLSFINMIRYSMDLLDLDPNEISILYEQEMNYYDLLVEFLIHMVNLLLQRGFYKSYIRTEDNLEYLRGKIMFKENLIENYGIQNKLFCSFDELTSDVLENRIIKYTVSFLLQCNYFNKRTESNLSLCYSRLNEIGLVPIYESSFSTIEYSPLNMHYKPILSLCKIFLEDSLLNIKNMGEKTGISFLIDMNKIFENFVANLLIEQIGTNQIVIQKVEYPEVNDYRLSIRPDIQIQKNGKPLLVLDTKYRLLEQDNTPSIQHVSQMSLYSLTTGVSKCALVYVGNHKLDLYYLKSNLNLYVLAMDTSGSNAEQFNHNCKKFVNEISEILSH